MPNPDGRTVRDREITESPTLRAFLEDWLQSIVHSVRPRTWARYSEYVHLHVVPTLGNRTLEGLTPKDIQTLYSQKIRQGLSPRSVLHLHRVIHRALAHAHRWGLVDANQADLVEPPRPEQREMKALSPSETRRVLDAASGDRFEALYVMALTTGMRQGELLGLRWRDVDLGSRSVRVTGSLQYIPGRGLRISSPKTARSRRNVLISELAAAALSEHQRRQKLERAASTYWEDNDLVFSNRRGRPIYATNLLDRSFSQLLKRAGVPRVRFHDLRHTAATLLLGQGVHPKVVSELLGHTNTSITLDLYSHATPTMQREAAGAFDRLLSDPLTEQGTAN
jgi:integrase